MATRKSDPVGGGEKHGTIEIAYVKLSGNDTTLQRAVDAFTMLIKQQAPNGHALLGPKRVNALPATQPKSPGSNGDEPFAADEGPIDIESTEAAEAIEPMSPSAPKAPRKFSHPVAISIETQSGTSVDDYVKQYNLDSNEEKYLALAGWPRVRVSKSGRA